MNSPQRISKENSAVPATRAAEASCPVCDGPARLQYAWTHRDIAENLERMYGAPLPPEANPVDYDILTCADCSLTFADPMQPGNDAFYNWITGFETYHYGARWEWDRIGTLLRARGGQTRLLELGCGGGGFLARMSAIEGLTAVGIDSARASVETARAKGLDVHHCEIDGLSERFKDREFDAIVLSHVLEHMDGPKPLVSSLKPYLARGGSIYVCVPYSPISTELISDSAVNLPPHHLSRWNMPSLTRLAGETGFTVQLFMPKPKSPLKRAIRATWVAATGSDPHVTPKISVAGRALSILRRPDLLARFLRRAYGRERVGGRIAADMILAVFTAP